MKVISLIGLLIILASIFNEIYQAFIEDAPEYYITMILFVVGLLLFFIPIMKRKKQL